MTSLAILVVAALGCQTHAASAEAVDIRLVRVDRQVAGRLHDEGLAPLPNRTMALTDRQALAALGQAGAATGTAIFAPLRYVPRPGIETPLEAQAYYSSPGGFAVEVAQCAFNAWPISFETRALDARVIVGIVGVEPAPAGGRKLLELSLDLLAVTRTPEAVADAAFDPASYQPVRSIDRLRVPESGAVVWAATHPTAAGGREDDAYLLFVSSAEETGIAGRLFDIRLGEAPRSLAEEIAGRELVAAGDGARPITASRAAEAELSIERAGGRLSGSARVRVARGREAGVLFRLQRPAAASTFDAFAVRLAMAADAGDRVIASLSNEWESDGVSPSVSRTAEIDVSTRLTLVWPVARGRGSEGPVLLVFITPVDG